MGMMMGIMTAGMSALQAGSSIIQGIDAQKEGENLATQYNYQAKQELMKGSGQIITDDYKAMQAAQRVASGTAAGGFTNTGSEKYVMANTYENQRVNDMYTRYSAKLASNQDIYAGQMAKYQGTQQMWGDFIQAGTAAASGGMKTYRGLTTGNWATSLSA